MDYNLLDEDWIPVLYRDGQWDRVGIRRALKDAGRIRQIAASSPMDRVAIVRFLLALLYWCRGNPPTKADAAESDPPWSNWLRKLDGQRACFNLLGDGKRFYQCLHSAKSAKKLSANYLVHEVPTGTNAWHFRHATDASDGLCPACCAVGLLRLPLFATSGGRGKPPGINAKPPLYVIPVGKSLAATLRLSWSKASCLGTPAWEEPDIGLPTHGEVPLLTGLTWLPRRVWLDSPDEPRANCISCGNKDRLIRHCVFAGLGSTKTDKESPARVWRDPHVIYDDSGKSQVTSLHASNALDANDAAAGQWARMMAGIVRKNEAHEGVDAWVVGFSTVQNDKYLEATEWFFPSPGSTEQVEPFIRKIEQWQKDSLARRCRPREGSSTRKHREILAAIAAVRPHVENTVSAKARHLLAERDEGWEESAHQYGPMMQSIAQSLSPGFTTAALERRRQIARVMPDMRPPAQPSEKSRRNKGDAK